VTQLPVVVYTVLDGKGTTDLNSVGKMVVDVLVPMGIPV